MYRKNPNCTTTTIGILNTVPIYGFAGGSRVFISSNVYYI